MAYNWESLLDPFYNVKAIDEWKLQQVPKAMAEATEEEKEHQRRKHAAIAFLAVEGALFAGGLTTLAVTRSARKRKGKGLLAQNPDLVASTAQSASNGLMAMIATPAIAIPFAYINVQMLEDAGVITHGVGNAVQGLMTASAAGGLIGGAMKLIGGLFPTGAP